MDPIPPPYDPIGWSKKPPEERDRMVCEAWAMQGHGTPRAVFARYALQIAAGPIETGELPASELPSRQPRVATA